MTGQTVIDYTTLETAIQDWLTRGDLTDANYLPEILQMAQDRICRGFTDNRGNYFPGLRIRQMTSLFSAGGIVTVTITAAGSGYTGTIVGLTFTAAPAGGVTATGYGVISGGALASIVLTNPGSGYTVAPTITVASGAATVTCTIGDVPTISPSSNFAVPADYLELDYMEVITANGPYRLERKPAEWIYKYYGANNAQGVPNYVARDGNVFVFAPTPDSGYAIGGQYFAQPAILSATNTTNFLTSTYPGLLLAACNAEATAFIRDWNANQIWEGRFSLLANSARMADRDEKFSGGPLAMLPG